MCSLSVSLSLSFRIYLIEFPCFLPSLSPWLFTLKSDDGYDSYYTACCCGFDFNSLEFRLYSNLKRRKPISYTHIGFNEQQQRQIPNSHDTDIRCHPQHYSRYTFILGATWNKKTLFYSIKKRKIFILPLFCFIFFIPTKRFVRDLWARRKYNIAFEKSCPLPINIYILVPGLCARQSLKPNRLHKTP